MKKADFLFFQWVKAVATIYAMIKALVICILGIVVHIAYAQGDSAPCNNAYPADGPFYSGGFLETQTPHKNLKRLQVASYNIHFSKDMPGVIKDLTENETLRNADFILLQEATGPIGGQGNTVEQIAQALKLNYVYAPAVVRYGADYGNAILSKWPMQELRKVLLPISNLEKCNQRIALGVTALVEGQATQVYSIHLSTKFLSTIGGEAARARQLKPAVEQMNLLPDMPTIIGGDFNDIFHPGWKKILSLMTANGYGDGHPVDGWTLKTGHFTIDHIFVRGFKFEGGGNVFHAKGSDHIPIWSDLSY
jgi:endonuclease/exonuclease/phosphatase family metal-dependent hydrolase